MNKNVVNPMGLKGKEQLQHIQELMGKLSPINESIRNSVVELTKKAADGRIYAIVRENHNYFIKVANYKKGILVTEDFQYIGGLQNITDESYPTYAKALKRLNGKLIALAENYNVSGEINAFANEHLLNLQMENEDETGRNYDYEKGNVKYGGKDFLPEPKPEVNLDEEVEDDEISQADSMAKAQGDIEGFQCESRMTSIAKAMNESDSDNAYCNSYVLPKGIEDMFESLDDIKKKV